MPMGHTATAQAGSGGLTATEHRLANGLRVVLSEDHLTPVAAVCLWYDVGSRHEVKGRTGLAHLFEHLMFQGSAPGARQRPLRAGAGGRRLAQRHHQLRAHQLLRDHARPPAGARALAGGRPHGLPPRRARRGVDGEPARRRQERAPPALRQRALRHRLREADRPRLPRGPPLPPHPDRLDGRPGRGDAGGRPRVLPYVLRAQQRGPRRSSATSTPSRRSPGSRSTSAPSPPTTASSRRATARCPTPSAGSCARSSRRTSRRAP